MEEAANVLGPDGEQTEEWKQFLKDNKERQDKWTRKNGIAHSGNACHDATQGKRQCKGVVRCTAEEISCALLCPIANGARNSNSVKMAPNETGSDFINQMLEAKIKLTSIWIL